MITHTTVKLDSHTLQNHLVQPWTLVALISLIYISITLARFNWNPMSFVIIGGYYDQRVENDSMGYDGQFAYQIALDPIRAPLHLDNPPYRYQRILYPLLARFLSFGIPGLLPWSMILINLVALVLGTWITGQILIDRGHNPWYALIYGLYIGLMMPIRLGLTEPLSFLFVQLGVLTFSRKMYRKSSAAFMLAVLARETAVLFILSFALTMILNSNVKKGIVWLLASLAPFVAWQVGILIIFGKFGLSSGGALAASFEWIPYRGWWGWALVDLRQFVMISLLVMPLGVIPSILGISIAVKYIVRKKISGEGLSLLLNAGALAFLPVSILVDTMGLSRVAAGLVVAMINFGSIYHSRRILNYSLLWIIPSIFLYKDSFLPVSEEVIRNQPLFLP